MWLLFPESFLIQSPIRINGYVTNTESKEKASCKMDLYVVHETMCWTQNRVIQAHWLPNDCGVPILAQALF